MDWRDEGRAGPREVRRIDPEARERPAELRSSDRPAEDDLFEDEHDGWQPVRRRSVPPSNR